MAPTLSAIAVSCCNPFYPTKWISLLGSLTTMDQILPAHTNETYFPSHKLAWLRTFGILGIPSYSRVDQKDTTQTTQVQETKKRYISSTKIESNDTHPAPLS